MRYTQGEWVIKPDNSIMSSKNKLAVICQLGSADNNDIEKEANAKLIAASKDLLEACKYAYAMLHQDLNDQFAPLVNDLRKAINKATL